jgi:3-ketosteroid 9alpha-monooxygenase subunit A
MGTMNSASDHRSALVPPPPGGWQLLGLASEIAEPVTGLALGSRALVAVRDGDGDGKVRVFDGTCPHRGAHLGHGGRFVGGRSIICPFHGKRIGLGEGTGRLCVREHETIDCDGTIFVRLSDIPARDHGFARVLRDIASTHAIVGAVLGEAGVPPELIIENAFDFSHFPTVHLIPRIATPKVWLGSDGELNITTAFYTQAPDWEAVKGDFTSDFHARAFSPHLVVSELGSGTSSKFVITGAVPTPTGCIARIAIAVPRGESPETVAAVVDGSQIAFKQDLLIWDNLNLSAPVRLDSGDAPVMAFRAFCASFAAAPGTPQAGDARGNSAKELADPLAVAGRGGH